MHKNAFTTKLTRYTITGTMSHRTQCIAMLQSMGFEMNHISRAFRVYEKNYGYSYNVEVITEIIVRLINKDKAKGIRMFENYILKKLHWSWTKCALESDSFYKCIAVEIYENKSNWIRVKDEMESYMRKYKPHLYKIHKNCNSLRVKVRAVSITYNVRVVVFKYVESCQSIVPDPAIEIDVNSTYVPNILLAKIEESKYHIINDFNGYSDYLSNMKPETTQISTYCNYWMIQRFRYPQGLPMELFATIKMFMPKFNVRPIGKQPTYEG